MANKFTLSTVFDTVDRITGPTKTMFGKATNAANKSNKAVNKMGRGLRNVGRIALAAGAAFATGALIKSINDFAERGDEIAKTSRQIGLAAESLQELRFAADRQGVSNEILTKSLKLLNRNVGDLRAGTGTLTTFLNKTNPALAEQLKNVTSNEQAFNLLITEIEKMPNQMDKAALAQAAFGRSGQDMIKVAEVGVEGIAALREEARKYGNIISTDAAKGSERFVDAMTNARAAVQGLANRGLAPLVEKLTPTIEKFADWVASNQELIGQRMDQLFTRIGDALDVMALHMPKVIDAFAWLRDNWKLVVAGLIAIKAAQWGLNAAMAANPVGAVIASLVALGALILVIINYWDEITAKLTEAWNWFDKLLGNPWIRLALSLIAQPILAIAAAVRTVIDLLSGEGLSSFKNLIDAGGGIWSAGRAIAQGLGIGGGQNSQIDSPISPNAGLIESRSTEQQTVDINVAAEPGTRASARTRGRRAPGVTINTGPAFQGAGASGSF